MTIFFKKKNRNVRMLRNTFSCHDYSRVATNFTSYALINQLSQVLIGLPQPDRPTFRNL